MAVTACTKSFDGLAACGVNDTMFVNNHVARQGGAVVIGSGPPTSYVEFHRCTVENSTTGNFTAGNPQGTGGAFAVDQGATLVMNDCLLVNNACGNKVCMSDGRVWEAEWVGSVMATVFILFCSLWLCYCCQRCLRTAEIREGGVVDRVSTEQRVLLPCSCSVRWFVFVSTMCGSKHLLHTGACVAALSVTLYSLLLFTLGDHCLCRRND